QHLLRIWLAVIQQPDSFHLCHARRALHLRRLHLQRRIEHNKRFSHLPLLLSVRRNVLLYSIIFSRSHKFAEIHCFPVGVGTLASPSSCSRERISPHPGRRKRPHSTSTPLPPLRDNPMLPR